MMAEFGFESTADDVLAGQDLSGRTALVTGATSGIGWETARALAAAGAHVVFTARDATKADEAVGSLRQAVPAGVFDVVVLELASLASVRDAAKDILARFPAINILINNAAVMTPPFGRTADGFETQFGTNHIGHFVLTNLLVPALVAGAPSRVVVLSSAAHQLGGVLWDDINFERAPYDRAKAYAQAKTANMLFAVELDRRLRSRGVPVFGVHPGVINTNLHRHLTKEILAELRASAATDAGQMAPQMRKTIPQGAATSVWAATAPELDGKGGLYLQDCGIAPPATPEVTGVKPYALDPAAAARLWEISERMVGETFALS
jgi:NAD(P)-dependent dehydrogenase (short-subunit alcohol dehydrogenase family)